MNHNIGTAASTSALLANPVPAVDNYYSSVVLHLTGDSASGNDAFIDSSPAATVLTVGGTTGSVSQGSVAPFFGTGWGSIYFNNQATATATGSTIVIPSSAASNFNFGTGDFTVECWVSIAAYSGGLFFPILQTDSGTAVTAGALWVGVANSGVQVGQSGLAGPANVYAGNQPAAALGLWYHIAISRSSGVFFVFVNGTLQTKGTASGNNNGDILTTTSFSCTTGALIGFRASGVNGATATNNANGHISGLRVTKGAALYTSAFPAPRTPVTSAVSAGTCVLLLNGVNASLVDQSGNVALINVGVTQTNATSRFGKGSLSFNGTSSYVAMPYQQQLVNLTSVANVTIEAWVNCSTTVGIQPLIAQYSINTPASTAGFALRQNGATFDYMFGLSTNAPILTGGVVTPGVWQHVAVTRLGAGSTGPVTCAVSNITGSGPWTATITGVQAVQLTSMRVGQIISASAAGTGSLGTGGVYTIASIVNATSITFTATGGTTPIAGTLPGLAYANYILWVNGVQVAQAVNSSTGSPSVNYTLGNYYGSAAVVAGSGDIGTAAGISYFNGYLDEVKITRGVARYQAPFTPSTSPTLVYDTGGELILSAADSLANNVTLLLDFENGVVDTSHSALACALGSTAAISTSQAYFGAHSLALATSANSSLVSTATSAAVTLLPTSDFCVDTFYYRTSSTGTGVLWTEAISGATGWTTSTSTSLHILLYVSNATGLVGLQFSNGTTSPTDTGVSGSGSGAIAIPLNAWTHVAVTYSAAYQMFRVFINGTETFNYPATSWVTPLTNRMIVGNLEPAAAHFDAAVGFIDRFRVTQGVQRYAGNFNVDPASFDPFAAFTTLMLHFDGNLADSSPQAHTLTAVGNAAASATNPKFGTGSLVVPNTTSATGGTNTITLALPSYVTATVSGLSSTAGFIVGNPLYSSGTPGVVPPNSTITNVTASTVSYVTSATSSVNGAIGLLITVSDYVTIPASSFQAGLGDFTVEGWVYAPAIVPTTGTTGYFLTGLSQIAFGGWVSGVSGTGPWTGTLSNMRGTVFLSSGLVAVGDIITAASVSSQAQIGLSCIVSAISGSGPWTGTLTGDSVNNLNTANLTVGQVLAQNVQAGGSMGNGGVFTIASIVSPTQLTFTTTGGTTPVAGTLNVVYATGTGNIATGGVCTVTSVGSNGSITFTSTGGTIPINGAIGTISYVNGVGVPFTINQQQTTSLGFTAFQQGEAFSEPLLINTWSHVAYVRAGGYLKSFRNGMLTNAPAVNTNNYNVPSPILIGANCLPSVSPAVIFGGYQGYFDDVRFTVGVARYNRPFQPPARAVLT